MTPPSRAAALSAANARAALDRITRSGWPAGCPDTTQAVKELREAVEIHDELVADRLTWEVYDADLRRMAEPHAAAVDASAEGAEELSWVLAEAVEKHLGREAAEYISSGTERQAAA